ncbi:MAG TPA: M12 family metallo-peptidase [Pyrinomonadaceae bacterium]|nr:M12 family metallo-peptidase [Pyrinomonadaceae bacterium]
MRNTNSNTRRIPPRAIRPALILALLGLIVLGLVVGTDWSAAAAISRTSQNSNNQNTSQSDELWKDVDKSSLALMTDHQDAPKQYRLLQLNKTLFSSVVSKAPLEFTSAEAQVLSLPLPDGRFWRFQIVESPVLSPELAGKFPEIKTYSGQSIDDATATLRFSWTPKGLNALVINEQGTFVIAPTGNDNQYLSYFTRDLETKPFECLGPVDGEAPSNVYADSDTLKAELNVANGTLRRYRLAVTVTTDFIFAVGGETVAGAGTIAAVTNYVNNVRAVYEREIGVSFNLVAVWNPVAFGAPLTNGDLKQMGLQNQFFLDHLNVNGFTGASSYDIGFALGFNPQSPSGLVLALGCACQPTIKAEGAALVPGPSINDYGGSVVMIHEIGHMFGAQHTLTPIFFNDPRYPAVCAQQAEPPVGAKMEPGSGSTIMSYAGVCPPDNLFTPNFNGWPDAYFHIHSLFRIADHKNAFSGCGQSTSTGNSPPVITNPGAAATIPALTPFTLTAAATDPNGDTLTYAWEEWDPGSSIFRSFPPITSPSRTFPSLTYILNNGNMPPTFIGPFFTGELLPPAAGLLNFTVTVRDNRSSGGGITARDQLLLVTVVGTAGPFRVTQPNTPVTLSSGGQTTITWNVANTNLAPIATSAVRILLSTDGGITFPTVLSNSTANDGFEVITLPNVQTATARVKIEAVGNIYFDISDTNFTISNNAGTLQFSAAAYSASEGSGKVDVTVTRSGSTAGAASVNFATSDIAGLQSCGLANGRASERCDYATSLGTVTFAAGETLKTFTIPFINDVLLEGNETFTISLNSATGASLSSPATATVTIVDNDFLAPASNPIDGVEFFIRQQYLDILNRPPDPTGLQNWINTLAPCPNGGFGEPPTSNCDRLHVAAGFFESDEFLNRGYWAFRVYMVSYNQRPTYAQFIPDMAQVGGPKSPAEEEASKVTFADAFVQRPEFLARYGSLTGQALANALLQTAGLPSSTFTITANMTRGQILRGIMETAAVANRFLTEGKVSIQYFGFLRRDPDTIGYQNNVNTLNANPSNLRHMIFIFIYSTEYRSRFGPT